MTLPIVHPIIPRSARKVPVGRAWRYEVKLDGFRSMLYVENSHAFFRSKGMRVMYRFQSLADQLAKALDVRDAILDGEIIVMREQTPDFYALMFRRGTPEFATFDLVWLNGHDLREQRFTDRKKRLGALLAGVPAIGYVEHYLTPHLFEAASRLDLEGIVAKRVSDPYESSTEWVKVRHPEYPQWKGRHELFDRHRRSNG